MSAKPLELDLLSRLRALQPVTRFILAYSGGLDSTVLVHAFTAIQDQLQIPGLACHVNHGLHPEAHQWSEHCREQCQQLVLPFESFEVSISTEKSPSLEALAREKRYEVFKGLMQRNDCLLTAHHQDDQAETVLFRLFRGAGVKGLGAMAIKRPFAEGQLVRPLIDQPREVLAQYAKENHLGWIDDPSNQPVNQQEPFDRNFIRHQVIPLIKKRWPEAVRSIARAADHCQAADSLLTDYSQALASTCQGVAANTLSVNRLLELPEGQLPHVIRWWIASLGFSLPSQRQLELIVETVLKAREDAMPLFTWSVSTWLGDSQTAHSTAVEIRRFRDDLYAIESSTEFDHSPIDWDLNAPITLGNGALLTATAEQGRGIAMSCIHQPVTIRFRQGGERCQPLGRQGSHPLKKLFQEWQIPPWQRDHIPLIYVGDQLAAVPGHCITEPFKTEAGEEGWCLTVESLKGTSIN